MRVLLEVAVSTSVLGSPGMGLESGWKRESGPILDSAVEVGLLGPLQVIVNGAEVALTAAKVRALLAFLTAARL